MSNKLGFIYYELLICFVITTLLIYFLLSSVPVLFINIENQKQTADMKQILALNVVLIENHQQTTSGQSYIIKQKNQELCIEWVDLKNENRSYCEKIWI